MGKKKPAMRSEVLAVFESLVRPLDGIEIKGAKSSYCAVNGNMFCFLATGDRLALRLPKQVRADFLETHEDCICVEHATVMKEYVLVPDAILNNRRKLNPLFKQCCEYAYSLKPKATTKKKAKKKVVKKKVKGGKK